MTPNQRVGDLVFVTWVQVSAQGFASPHRSRAGAPVHLNKEIPVCRVL